LIVESAIVVDSAMPTLYDVSTVQISVTDENDHQPIFTYPSSAGNDTAVIQLTSSVHVGHVVTQVKATDADVGVNAELSYDIINEVSGNSQHIELFAIDRKSGEVTVAASLPYASHSVTYELMIAVTDAGTPSLTSQTMLHILVNETVSHSNNVVSRRWAQSSSSSIIDMTWWLVAGGCAAAMLIVFGTLCLLIGVNKKRRRRRPPRTNSTTTSTTTTPRTASLSRRKTQAPAPLGLMTDIDPLTSAMLRRHQFDDVTLVGQAAAGARTAGVSGTCKSAPVSTLRLSNTVCAGHPMSIMSSVYVCLSVRLPVIVFAS